jgi:predicted TIM-barrel fold metal-dependent hydrolase
LSFREELGAIAHVDHHAHAILRAPAASLDEFRGLFSESRDPRQWPHAATTVMYRRAIGVLAAHLGCEATEEAVYERRSSSGLAQYAQPLLRAAGAEVMLVDDGYPQPDTAVSLGELEALAGCPVRPVMRIETLATNDRSDRLTDLQTAVAGARERGFAALKTIVAYRGGLELDLVPVAVRSALFAALEVNEAGGDPLPVQVHCGFGDSDLFLPRARPGYLKHVFEQFPDTTFVLLHCYPFIREAAWLTSVYANVFMDLSLTIPHVARPSVALAEALELAPVSKLLYASDAVLAPELYLLASVWWRDALADVLTEQLPADAAEAGARMILRENANALYRL